MINHEEMEDTMCYNILQNENINGAGWDATVAVCRFGCFALGLRGERKKVLDRMGWDFTTGM
jgi:hypothetical protein